MKTFRSFSPNRGVALVIVLSMIVLVLIITLSFFTRMVTERSASSGSIYAVETENLAASTVATVESLIGLATTETTEANGFGLAYAWASQPGMIRTFENDGRLRTAYKLYSAPDLISNSVSLIADLPPNTWASDVSVWSDLNEPAEGLGGRMIFPIAHPPSSVPVAGFSVTSGSSPSAADRLPMPVRWLYVLQNGGMVSASGNGTTATVSGATLLNPIVGRVAFWTDDDTSKVNINTASEGTFWNTPRTNSNQDRNLGKFQPARNQFQAYPGHPSTTSLSTIFPNLTRDQIYSFNPRILAGGSNNGTAVAPNTFPALQAAKRDRLYSTVDELLLTPERASQTGLVREDIEKARFFLTARSRAPELNLFGYPRVAVWPLHRLGPNNVASLTHTTLLDRLIAYCAQVQTSNDVKYPYFFQREIAASTSNDVGIPRNVQLLNYLSNLTGHGYPAFGGNFLTKYAADRNQILLEIFDYTRIINLSDDNIPVPTDRFTPPPDTTTDTIWGHGFVVPTVTKLNGSATTSMGFGRAVTVSEVAIGFICNAASQDNPATSFDETSSNTIRPTENPALLLPGTKRIQAILVPEFFAPALGWAGLNTNFSLEVSGLNQFQVNGTPLGFPATGTSDHRGMWNLFEGLRQGGTCWRAFGYGQAGFGPPGKNNIYPFISIPISINAAPSGGTFSFTGGIITMTIKSNGTGQTIQTIRVQIPSGTFPVPELVDSGARYNSLTPPEPRDSTPSNWWGFLGPVTSVLSDRRRLRMIGHAISPAPTPSVGNFFRATHDTVRSVIPKHGDYRLIAATNDLDDSSQTLFIKHPDYDNENSRVAATLSHSRRTNNDLLDETNRRYFAGLDHGNYRPDIYPGAAPEFRPERTGDFDAPAGRGVDGAYINKPDEGNLFTGPSGTDTPYFDSGGNFLSIGPTYFSPNRILPSAVSFGSLPTGVGRDKPWETLLFRPQPSHPNHSTTIPDHLLLDLFWLPVVEPYSISENFSTAGKINMNYQIMPFTYIQRATGIHALLANEKMSRIPDTAIITSKNTTNAEYIVPISIEQTLRQFQSKFDAGQIFRSATEICDLHMVPTGIDLNAMPTFWASHRPTGENLRERIYATTLPRLTTKSNTFTIHFRVQALQKVKGTPADQWDENRDRVRSEFRGSTTIERFLPEKLPVGSGSTNPYRDYAEEAAALGTPNGPRPLDYFYRWRVIEQRRFAP